MSPAQKAQPESERGELRRQQVLDAATTCFRREGFHGSSIARISRAAGMSPGHIYHYFANKEAIVEAIAAREENDLAELVRQMEQDLEGGDLVRRLTRHVGEAVERNNDPDHVGLMLELAAEAARNSAVAQILRRSDRVIDARFVDMALRVGIPAGLDEAELRLRMTMIATLFNGLAMRSIIDPHRDHAATVRLAERMIRSLLEQP